MIINNSKAKTFLLASSKDLIKIPVQLDFSKVLDRALDELVVQLLLTKMKLLLKHLFLFNIAQNGV